MTLLNLRQTCMYSSMKLGKTLDGEYGHGRIDGAALRPLERLTSGQSSESRSRQPLPPKESHSSIEELYVVG